MIPGKELWASGNLFYDGDNNATLGGGGLNSTQVMSAGCLAGTYSFQFSTTSGNTFSLVAIPEPSSAVLLGLAGIMLFDIR